MNSELDVALSDDRVLPRRILRDVERVLLYG